MMNEKMLVRFYHPEQGNRIGVKQGDVVRDVTDHVPSVGSFLRHSVGHVAQAIEGLDAVAEDSALTFKASLFDSSPLPIVPHWLPPVDEQDVWAAGVTYERSRAARQEEAQDGGDIYARVYQAERPELFFKAHGARVVGPFAGVGIRKDATWNVPEPELALMMNPAMEVVGFTVGNDMSSRDIEGANPLYLPQAKVYKASCALGPGILLNPTTEWPPVMIRLTIKRSPNQEADRRPGEPENLDLPNWPAVFAGEVHTSRIKRKISELADYLGRSMEFPDGVVLLTGTGIVPPSDFTLQVGDVVEIEIEGIGQLVNMVRVV
jgi:2-dehydro-3-deoxy-D-arabinonate dehydratase